MKVYCKPLLLSVCCVLVLSLVVILLSNQNSPSLKVYKLLKVEQLFKIKTVRPKDLMTKTDVSTELMTGSVNMSSCHKMFSSRLSEVPAPLNTVCIFTGRWHFLRVLLPHIFRELRANGGPIDRVWFMAMGCTDKDLKRLKEFATAANEILQEDVFVFHIYTTDKVKGKHGRPFAFAYCEMHANLLEYPNNHYFKIDDDVVYIHPGSFDRAIENKAKFPTCLVSLFNTAGGNWMCNRIMQDNGAFKGVDNPDNIDFHHVGGEGGTVSTKFALEAFLHYQKANQVEKLFISSRSDKSRFTMNAAMFDAGTFDPDLLQKVDVMKYTKDEPWLTNYYPKIGNRSNCIVGDALVVHFSHAPPSNGLVKLGMLKKFEDVVISMKKDIKMDEELWRLLDYK